ncbi:uncharacterized protein VTP21DRAFT_2218 [Calcarisporiella thermophila]|uniref:uncharacterized protein n=1 Tax=Calcarisporiella thermophila TaxID=911321 RepID=UPI0037433742
MKDHASLKYFQTQPTLTQRQARWMEIVQKFDFEILYQPGKTNIVADALSRRPDFEINTISTIQPPNEILGSRTANSKGHSHSIKYFDLRDDLLFFGEGGDKERLCISNDKEIRLQILQEHHDIPISGHLGIEKTYERVHRFFYWPRLQDAVKKYVTSCDVCQRTKSSNTLPAGLLQPLDTPTQKWQQVSMDLITQLPKIKNGLDAIVVFVDRLTKIARFVPTTTSANAPTLAKLFFDTVFRLHGLPQAILTD